MHPCAHHQSRMLVGTFQKLKGMVNVLDVSQKGCVYGYTCSNDWHREQSYVCAKLWYSAIATAPLAPSIGETRALCLRQRRHPAPIITNAGVVGKIHFIVQVRVLIA